LNKRRYAQHDDTLYVAPEDERTDYVWLSLSYLYLLSTSDFSPNPPWLTGITASSSALSSVLFPACRRDVLTLFSTGKRRYGHPALNGVLPEPWLPLKKGQALVNNDHRPDAPRIGQVNDTVVLTLRKRPSMVRNRGGSRDFSRGTPGSSNANGVDQDLVHAVINSNPWEDTRPQRLGSGSRNGNHRLSFDVASGVIMLPDNEDWLENDMDSDEEDYGIGNNSGLDGLIADLSANGDEGSASAISGEREDNGGVTPTIPMSPSRISRYGTYFHHPERRRQPIPGAFPVR
jgi:calcium permeable stress-gated cation channel